MGYSSVEAYKAADGWKEFFNIQPITSAPTAIRKCSHPKN